MSISIEKPKSDHIGEYYDHLPEGFRLASMDDFHVQGKKNLGMVFLVRWQDEVRYSLWSVKESLTAERLLPFINLKRVYVLEDPKSFLNH